MTNPPRPGPRPWSTAGDDAFMEARRRNRAPRADEDPVPDDTDVPDFPPSADATREAAVTALRTELHDQKKRTADVAKGWRETEVELEDSRTALRAANKAFDKAARDRSRVDSQQKVVMAAFRKKERELEAKLAEKPTAARPVRLVSLTDEDALRAIRVYATLVGASHPSVERSLRLPASRPTIALCVIRHNVGLAWDVTLGNRELQVSGMVTEARLRGSGLSIMDIEHLLGRRS